MRVPAAVETPSAVLAGHAGDGLLNRFHLAALTFQRARQLNSGARPRVDAAGHKLLRVALLEVMAGMISWDVT